MCGYFLESFQKIRKLLKINQPFKQKFREYKITADISILPLAWSAWPLFEDHVTDTCSTGVKFKMINRSNSYYMADCLTRTGNYRLAENDIDRGLDFPN